MIAGILTEGFIYGIMVLAVFYTFRMLNFCDMTVDGSFPLGACVLGVCYQAGAPTLVCLVAAFAAGCLAGLVTALIHTRLKVPDILAGIITMTMLYSINLRVLSGAANLSFLKIPTFFSRAKDFFGALIPGEATGDWTVVIISFLTLAVFMVLLDLFFRTDFGLCTGALGSNPQFIISQGMNPDILKIVGISISNGMVAVAGSYFAMYQGFADINAGTGTIVAGLASLLIGEFFVRSNRISVLTARAVLGSVVYRALMYLARNYGYLLAFNVNGKRVELLSANDLKLITGILIILCLIVSKTNVLKRRKGHGAA
jgi:putative ABC transport system permease protein